MATKKLMSYDRLIEYDALIKSTMDEKINIAKNELLNGAKADWNQNDETASDYVKNRPFYDNTEVLLDTITVSNGDTLDSTVGSNIGAEGDVVTVIWDGVSFEKTTGSCVHSVKRGGVIWEEPCTTLGNQSILNDDLNTFEDTGEDYLITVRSDGVTTVHCDENSHTLSIVKGTLVQIDEKFIPGTIARVSDVDEKIDEAIANVSEVKMPITLGAFQYFKWGNLPGSTVEEKASHLAKYDVIVYQDSLCNDLEMNDAGYERDLALYKKALEYNPDLKVFGYVTTRGFANLADGSHVGMTEYRTSPSNVDHPIWTKEELCAYIKLMAHCGGTIDASKTDEYGNKEITGGIPLYGVFFDDYDYNFENDNAHLMNQGDWATIREKHNFLIDYCHSQGLHVMPNSSPDLIFGNEATPNSIRNPDGVPSHMSEGDWFCCESYFLRSDYTFSLTDSHMPTFTNKYKDEYKCKSLALAYVYAVSDDAEDNEQIASTFAIYQALCHGVDSIALHGSSLFTEIPEEFSKYYDINNNAVYSTGSGYATLKVNGHTITASRSVNATQYGMEPNSHAFSTCLVNVDGHVFNNIYVRNEELEYKFKDLKGNVNTKIDELTTKVEQTSNLYHRAFIDDWEKNYTLDDYTNYAFTFENAFGGEDTGATSSWSPFAPYDFTVNLPAQWSWRKVLMDASHLAGKTVELGFETSDAYLSTSVATKVNPVWQIVGVCESNSNLNITTLNVKATQKSQVDGVTRCCVRFTMPEDINQLMFWTQRTDAFPSGTWTIDVTGTYLVDLNEYQKQKTWFTNYAPPMSEWGAMGNWSNYEILRDGDAVTTRYTATANCYESGVTFPANNDIFKPGETWEIGFKHLSMGRGVNLSTFTNKIVIMMNIGTEICPDLYIWGKTSDDYANMKSATGDDSLIAITRFTIPETYSGGMPETSLYIWPENYIGGDSNGLYQLYVEGLYLYKLDERDELVVRGEEPSDTLIGLNRVRTDTIDSKLAPDTLYIVDNGSMFITDFRGTRIDIGSTFKQIIMNSSTEGSTKQFKLTIDDNGILTVSEIVVEEVE